MRANSLLVASICLNMVLAVGFAIVSRKQPSAPVEGSQTSLVTTSTIIKPAILVRKQFFNWSELESEDYATYIANLRSVNCPEDTIRDIIVADVDQLFEKKRLELRNSGGGDDIEWWKNPGATSDNSKYWEAYRQLSVERTALLAQLLGNGWNREAPNLHAAPVCFGGAVLSALSPSVKQRIREIVEDLNRKLQMQEGALTLASLADNNGAARFSETINAEDAARTAIKSLLTAEQFEEYELRNSRSALKLRYGLPRGFNTAPEEFRRLFRNTSETARLLDAAESEDESDPAVAQRIAELSARLEREQIAALGVARFAELTRLQDSDYRDAISLTEEYTNSSPATLQALFDINKAAAQEISRLDNVTNWTDLQLQIAATRIELAQLEAQARALGQPVPENPAASSAPPFPEVTPPDEPAPPAPIRHTIRIGESLGSIATAYGLPVNAILGANPGLQLNQVRPGQVILIPAPAGSGR